MQATSENNYFSFSSPLNLLEELFFQYEWTYDRLSENEVNAEAEGRWCSYRLFALWRQDLESLVISCITDIKIPEDKKAPVSTLLTALNPKIWLGHFEILLNESLPVFRYNLTLKNTTGASLEQMEEIISSAVVESDRLYPALQFVLWGGKSPEDALMAAMMDTIGEA